MSGKSKLDDVSDEEKRWNDEVVRYWLYRMPERREEFLTSSGFELKRLYTPVDTADADYLRDIGFPGDYPFTRGLHATMYRGRFWTMRQFSGFGTADETNRRFKYLLDEGETEMALSVLVMLGPIAGMGYVILTSFVGVLFVLIPVAMIDAELWEVRTWRCYFDEEERIPRPPRDMGDGPDPGLPRPGIMY